MADRELRINLNADEQRQLSAAAADLGISPRELATKKVREGLNASTRRKKPVEAKAKKTKTKKANPDVGGLLSVFKKYAIRTKRHIDDSRESIYGDDR